MSKTKTILILAANPKDTNRLRLDEEAREIDEGLRRSRSRDKLDIVQRWALNIRDIRRVLLDYDPQIIHLIGHGKPEGLMVEDESGKVVSVNPEALSKLFEIFAGSVECVIMNAYYFKTHAKAIGKHIPYVVGIRKELVNEQAIEFFLGFRTGEGDRRESCTYRDTVSDTPHLTTEIIFENIIDFFSLLCYIRMYVD
jgi:hypothetical protein